MHRAFMLAVVSLFCLTATTSPSSAAMVKLSKSGICHSQSSAYYERTKSFTPYDSVEACLEHGRLPKGGSAPAVSRNDRQEAQPWPSAGQPYDRSAFGGWADEDGDCLNTRHELLLSLSTAVVDTNPSGCSIARGKWYDPYTGNTYRNARDLDIDHLVPLAYAWTRGADGWSSEKRERFANDPANLFAVDASTNRQKGAAGPTEWLPPYSAFHCQYITRFIRVMKTYGLEAWPGEEQKMKSIQGSVCK